MPEKLRGELRSELRRIRLRDSLVDSALDYILSTNPLETVLKPISECSEDDVDLDGSKKRISEDVETWLDMYEDLLEKGKSLPVDLIGKAADLAKESREETKSE